MEWYQYLSDTYINKIITLIAEDYKVASMFVAGPVLWALSKWTSWTPWTTDDKLGDMIEKRLGIKQ